ncbi:type II/IV secretion system protein [Candidatus Microgenomates bacterium]|nr:type II/IV secretion system protein [Candidatus Microgenomates bacterium]
MHLSDMTVQELLGVSQKFSPAKIKELADNAGRNKESLQDLIYKRKLLSEKELTKLYADSIKARFVELGNIKIDPKLLKRIPEHIARRYQAVLFGSSQDKLKLAIADPGDLQAVDFLEKLLGKSNVEVYIATSSDINRILDQYRGELEKEITKVIPEVEAETKEVSAAEVAEDSPVAKTANLIIEYAIKSSASDIHIEPREDGIAVRYRIDGILRETETLPKNILSSLVSRLKIMANMKIDEHRKPQDGRFKITEGDRIVAVRVSVIPVMDGEKVVMRLLDESSRAMTLEELGFNSSALQRMQRAMAQPHGMILVTGPTGSGKSTTLYSILSMLNTPQVNISTVEDPVEYRIAGVNQTQVNPRADMTFATGLRALLRQDPNIIMVGEIRDAETSDLAIQAALTGHLVLSTLHTNNAATTLPRLLDMGAEPFLIASTVRVAVGQRLVRRLCPNCRLSYRPTEQELAQIKEQFQPEQTLEQLQKVPNQSRPLEQENTDKKTDHLPAATEVLAKASQSSYNLWKVGPGCEVCGLSGYKGRMGIFEVLEVTEAISKLIVANATSDDIQAQGIREGMITMQNDGFIKVLQGLTSIEEVLRVTRD